MLVNVKRYEHFSVRKGALVVCIIKTDHSGSASDNVSERKKTRRKKKRKKHLRTVVMPLSRWCDCMS